MLKKLVKIFGGDPNQRKIEAYSDLVDQINLLEAEYERLSNEQLGLKTDEFRTRLAQGETLDDIMLEAFATVREASKRTLGQRHYDVQLIGGIALHRGIIAEMRTGEGKTLVATLPVYLNALTGEGVHLITVNDYLARRDARWMAPIYNLLGLSVGVLQMAARTENGKKAFLVDLDKESSQEDQHQLVMVPRREAYRADITYGTNSEFGFDYLRDNMTMRLEDRVQRGHYYAIIDEVDNVLIDEARTPLIISGPAQDEAEWYERMAQVVRQLRPEDYEINEKDRNVTLTEIGETHVEELLGVPLRDPDRPEDVTNEQARLLGYLEQALRAQFLFRRNKDYLVQAGKVVIIDEFTGRLMPGRRWSDGLHQAVEAKEGVKVQSESVTYATITIQNYFRMYKKLAGMTGTALTEAEEFDEIYKLEVLAIPTNLEYEAQKEESGLDAVDDRDENGYRVRYYAHTDDPSKRPVFWQRKDYPDVVYRTEEAKLRSIAGEILRFNTLGRPLLVGTTSVELSEQVSGRLRAEPLRRLAQVLVLREVWFQKHGREEDGRAVPELNFLNQPLESLELAEMRRLARELDISFNPNADENLERLRILLDLPRDPYVLERLDTNLKAGIPHEVLNARKHTEESQIIAGAGAFGAVTIATNMAGRGVDIKLGGELAEEILATISRVLEKAGHDDPYSMTMEQRRQALLAMDPEDHGIYETEVKYFLQHMEEMEKVRELGGLHVIGSERHEARRIDNQLRGRAARQGDPGSSRFYLSMEDDLMRLFGGNQVDSLMQRLHIDDAMPLEVGLVSRIVEQSQTRVEGANFDVRKHLLEYDDVLNSQRAKIYGQRDRIFTKDDLSDDVIDMLRAEVNLRVPEALLDEDGPWKLLAWLDQIQPSLNVGGYIFPSFTLKLLADGILEKNGIKTSGDGDGREAARPTLDKETAREDLLEVAENALEAEKRRLLHTVDRLLVDAEDRLENQIAERLEGLDMFFEGLELEDEEGGTRSPAQLAEELNAVVRVPLRLSPSEQKSLRDDPEAIRPQIEEELRDTLVSQTVTRLIGAIERRLEESLEIKAENLPADDWNALSDQVLDAIEAFYEQRAKRYFDRDGGLIVKDLDNALRRLDGPVTRMHLLQLLTLIPQGARATFDKKTHRRVWQRTTRLSYADTAAERLVNRETEEVTADILEHLENAMNTMRQAWGASEWARLSTASATLNDLEEKSQRGLRQALGEDVFAGLAGRPLQSLEPEYRRQVVDELGRQALTNIYRQLLLGVISELWVDYLTQMEALRISIGLEAYAQRDPLVQYKNQAYGLFQDLLSNMRNGVVNRMFTYRPRDLESVQSSVTRSDGAAVTEEPPATPEEAAVEAAAQAEPAAAPAGKADGAESKPARKKKGKGKKLSNSAKRRRSRSS